MSYDPAEQWHAFVSQHAQHRRKLATNGNLCAMPLKQISSSDLNAHGSNLSC